MEKNFKIIIITFVVFTLGIGFFGVTNAGSNLFGCKYRFRGSAEDCYADTATADCDAGKVVDSKICDEFDTRPDFCKSIKGQCINPLPIPCETDSDCSGKNVCEDDVCIFPSSIPCDADDDCRDGYICSLKGTCAPSDSSAFRCTEDSECAERYGEGYVCFTESEGGVGGCGFPRDGGDGGGLRLENPLAADSFEEFIVKLINSLIIFSGPILALIVAIGGFKFVLAGANPKQKEDGMKMIKYGVIGFIIMLSAWILVAILKSLF